MTVRTIPLTMETEPQNTINNSEKRGPGRPKGSSNKQKIWQFVTPDEITELVELAKKEAREGKTDMLKFLLEQIFGKARQSVGLDGGDEGVPINIIQYGDTRPPVQTEGVSDTTPTSI